MTVTIPDDTEAVVYDLDGTLVRLTVDWEALEERVADVLRAADVDCADLDAWEMLDAAAGAGIEDEVESAFATAERDGARESIRLPLADTIADRTTPIGVCSLNCEAACRIALDTHELTTHVESVVGRDSVAGRKPDPEPLLTAVAELGATPERTLFVGDSAGDETTADRAGTRFSYVGDGPTSY